MDLNGKTIELNLWQEEITARFILGQYSNGRTAIRLQDTNTGEPLATLTVNIPEVTLAKDEFLVKTWSENEAISEACIKSGLFLNTGKTVKTGFVLAQVWKEKEGEDG